MLIFTDGSKDPGTEHEGSGVLFGSRLMLMLREMEKADEIAKTALKGLCVAF